MESQYHIPVLLEPSVSLLNCVPDGCYVDATFGGGGHSRAILDALGTEGKLIAFDKDPDVAINQPKDGRFEWIQADFRGMKEKLYQKGIKQVDGILADLGVSSHQFDTAGRGFSFRFDAPLDMRMSQQGEQTAASLLNEMEEPALAALFWRYGEIKNAKKLARAVAQGRKSGPISRSSQLETLIRDCLPPRGQSKYLAQLYQALRIEVNDELGALEQLLMTSLALLKPGGVLVIIAYHSLEDRMVKRFLRSGNFLGKVQKDFYGNDLSPWRLLTRRAIKASESEITANPRARSARLRAAIKRTKDEI